MNQVFRNILLLINNSLGYQNSWLDGNGNIKVSTESQVPFRFVAPMGRECAWVPEIKTTICESERGSDDIVCRSNEDNIFFSPHMRAGELIIILKILSHRPLGIDDVLALHPKIKVLDKEEYVISNTETHLRVFSHFATEECKIFLEALSLTESQYMGIEDMKVLIKQCKVSPELIEDALSEKK